MVSINSRHNETVCLISFNPSIAIVFTRPSYFDEKQQLTKIDGLNICPRIEHVYQIDIFKDMLYVVRIWFNITQID